MAAATFGEYALPGAACVIRVFLPLMHMGGAQERRWSEFLAGRELSGDLTAPTLLEWGQGSGSFQVPWRPAGGRASHSTISQVSNVLAEVGGVLDQWLHWPLFYGDGLRSGVPMTVKLSDFNRAWSSHLFPGRIEQPGCIRLDAPPYADSIIMSGPHQLVVSAEKAGLEVVRVARSTPLPVMEW